MRLRIGAYEFSPTPLPSLAVAVGVAMTVSLGRWQLSRAAEKQSLRERYAAMQQEPPIALTGRESDGAGLEFRRLTAHGAYEARMQIYLDNKVHQGRAGYHVVTPLKLAAGRYVLVNRGWIARGPDYPSPPDVAVPPGEVSVEGYGVMPPRFYELSDRFAQGAVWQNLTFARFTDATGLEVVPLLIAQSRADPGLTPVKHEPEFNVSRHYGYALQWFSLAAVLTVMYVVVSSHRIAR